jgi:hypothetical protein
VETDNTMRGAAGTAFGEDGRTLKEATMQKAQAAKDQVRELANHGRQEVAGQLDCVARALRGAGDQIGEESAQASQYTRLAGDKVGELATYLRDHDAVDLVHDVEGFARTNPLVFLGGCAVAGFLIGRFFKASPVQSDDLELELDYPSSAYETPAYGTPGYETAGAYGYDTRITSMPRPPAIEPQSSVVAQPTINTPVNTPDPWRPSGGSGNGNGV